MKMTADETEAPLGIRTFDAVRQTRKSRWQKPNGDLLLELFGLPPEANILGHAHPSPRPSPR